MTTRTSATTAFAEFATGLTMADVPTDVIEYARLLVKDTLGAGIYGRRGASSSIVYADSRRRSAEGPAQVWGRASTLEASAAAFVNGVQAHEYELDDYVAKAKLHPGVSILPAALAVAGPETSGSELLLAVIAGYEVMVRISVAAGAAAVRRRGWHLTGLLGPFGAATAASRILGADVDQLVSALGAAGSYSGGPFAFSQEGSMTKSLHAGKAAQAGVVCAQLALEGFDGPRFVLDADEAGLLAAISDSPDPDLLTRRLGEGFEIAGTSVKPYPCCGSVHSSIDAVLRLRAEHGLRADDVAEILVLNSSNAITQCGFEYHGDGGALEGRMSFQYCLAVALERGGVRLEDFEPASLRDDRLRRIARMVHFEIDPGIDAIYPREYPARVRITLVDGTELETYVPIPTGGDGNRMPADDLEQKFFNNTADSEVDARLVSDLVDHLDDIDSIEPLARALAPSTVSVAR